MIVNRYGDVLWVGEPKRLALKWRLVRLGILKVWTVRSDSGRAPLLALNLRWWARLRAWPHLQAMTPAHGAANVELCP